MGAVSVTQRGLRMAARNRSTDCGRSDPAWAEEVAMTAGVQQDHHDTRYQDAAHHADETLPSRSARRSGTADVRLAHRRQGFIGKVYRDLGRHDGEPDGDQQ